MMNNIEKNKFELECKLETEKRWRALLAKKNENNNEPFYYTPFNNTNITSFFAIDNEGTRKIYLPLTNQVNFKQDKRSASIQVLKSTNELFNKEHKEYIEICCLNPDSSDFIYNKFNTLISMIFTSIKFDQIDNYSAVKNTIQEWRDFLRLVKKKHLSIEEVRGLIGELHFLNDLLAIDKNLFESWHGPEAERHDFRQNNISVEVKTTSSKNKIVKISSLDQLEKPNDTELFCQFYQLEQDDKGFSIPSLIDKIMDTHSISKIDIERKLNDLNYDFNDRKYYENEKYKFRILNNYFYIVDDHFPKIIRNSFKENKIPKGVMSLEYKIDLNGLDEKSIEDKEIILTKMAN